MSTSEQVQRTRRKNAKFVADLKTATPCADCGESYPSWVMEFDHVRGDKLFELSKVTRTNISMKRILEEIEKCEIVCSNCHSERTHQRRISLPLDFHPLIS